jgi:hypothetical protein
LAAGFLDKDASPFLSRHYITFIVAGSSTLLIQQSSCFVVLSLHSNE